MEQVNVQTGVNFSVASTMAMFAGSAITAAYILLKKKESAEEE